MGSGVAESDATDTASVRIRRCPFRQLVEKEKRTQYTSEVLA